MCGLCVCVDVCLYTSMPLGLSQVLHLSECHWFFCLIVIHYANFTTNLTFYWPKSNKLTNKQNKHYCNVGKTSVNINSIFTIIFNTNYAWCSMQAASDAWAEGSPVKHPLSLLGWEEGRNTAKKHRSPVMNEWKGKVGENVKHGASLFSYLFGFF